jgi:hypothetical protein
MGHHHHGLAELVDWAAKEAQHILATGLIQVPRRFVGDDDLGLVAEWSGTGKGPCTRSPIPLARAEDAGRFIVRNELNFWGHKDV